MLNNMIHDANEWLKKYNLRLTWITSESEEVGEGDATELSPSAITPAPRKASTFGQRLAKKMKEAGR